jgi:hypothetical protein
MYLQNKYTKCYYSIINRAKSRDLSKEVYTENHHIIPRSLGGSNESNNLVKLTAREHFICHLLLPKMLSGLNKRNMTFAIWSMLNRDHSKQRSRHKVNSHVYQRLKTQIATAISESNTGRKRSIEFREKMKKFKLGRKNPKISGDNHYTRKEGYVSKIAGDNHYMHGKTQDESTNQKRRDKILGTKRSDDTKKKQSEARKLYWAQKKLSN